MKFILNEHKKFILEEKFILKEEEVLTEASAADIAVKWTNHFKSTLNNTKEVLNKYIEFAGIPKFSQETKTKFTKVKETIKGQDEAVRKIVTALWTTMKFRKMRKKNMLIIGPSGVGKNTIADILVDKGYGIYSV